MPGELPYPDGPQDHEKIVAYSNEAHRQARSYRLEIERAAQRNVLYYLGVQWIKYDQSIRLWRPIAVGKRTPRPCTNKVATFVNQAVANLLNFRPPLTYSPATDRPEDIAAATVADRINAIIERESDIERLKAVIARWLILTGNVFLINNYDLSPESGFEFIGAEQCNDCGAVTMPKETEQAGLAQGLQQGMGVCPQCGGHNLQPATEQPGQPVPDGMEAQGGKVGTAYPKGRFKTEVEPVFTCHFDNSTGQDFHDSPYFMTVRHRGKDWITRMYGEEVAKNINYNQPSDPYSGMFESLAYATTLWSYGYGAPSSLSEPRARVKRIWIRPRPKVAPEGIYAVILDDKVVESGPWPYKDETGRPMLNVVHIGFDEVPGRTIYKSRVDDIIPKQDQRNRVESIIELHSIRMANSVWLVPEGVGLSKVTGEQGQVIKYNALQGVNPPSRVPGDQVSPYLIQWMGILDQEMQDIFGLSEVGRGEAPRGVSAYSALQLLDERAQQGQSAIMRNWAQGWLEWSRQNLALWKVAATDDRYLTTGAGQWSIAKFNKSALTGGVNITCEIGSFRPQTMLAKRALFEQLLRLGVINPQDPMQRYDLATVMGASDMLPDFKVDMEFVARRIDALKAGQTPPPPNPWENHQLAITLFARFQKTEQFEALPPPIQQRIVMYAALHFKFLQPPPGAEQKRQPGSVTPGPEGPKQKGVASDQNLGTEQGQLTRDQQQPSHPEMAGRG
jgi:hypothetical protein